MSKFIKVFLFASLLVSSFAVKAVTVASWGGAYTESQQKAYAAVSYTHLRAHET